MQALVSASRCIGVIIEESPLIGDQVVAEYSKAIQVSFYFTPLTTEHLLILSLQSAKTPTAALILRLLALGEIGRIV